MNKCMFCHKTILGRDICTSEICNIRAHNVMMNITAKYYHYNK